MGTNVSVSKGQTSSSPVSLSPVLCVFVGSPLRQRRGEVVLRQCDERRGWSGVIVSCMRSGAPELPAGGFRLCSLPRRFLH